MRQDEKVVRVREQGQVAICGGVGIYGLVGEGVLDAAGGVWGAELVTTYLYAASPTLERRDRFRT